MNHSVICKCSTDTGVGYSGDLNVKFAPQKRSCCELNQKVSTLYMTAISGRLRLTLSASAGFQR